MNGLSEIIQIGFTNTDFKTARAGKGNSLLEFPSEYTLIDLETTGLSPEYDSILEVCAMRVRNNKITDTFSSLVKSGSYIYVDEFITSLTGITEDMIVNAPPIEVVFPKFIDFIGDDVVIGHNINFDINFIYDESMRILKKAFSNDFIDTMRISRRLHPDQRHHRLSDLSEKYSISYVGSHRAKKDCEITKDCYDMLASEILQNYGSYNNFIEYIATLSRGVRAKDIATTVHDFDTSHPLYEKVCVFTGKLERMTRKEAMQVVADLGGINSDTVTKKTNFLILGNNDYCSSIRDGKSTKQKKAEKLLLEGQDITTIPEDVFYEIVGIK